MRPVICFCASLLLGVAAASAHAQPALPPLAHAKLLSCDGLPCVDATIGDKHLRLGFDTGNPNSLLDLKAAQALGLKLEPIMGPDGKPYKQYSLAHVDSVAVGDATLKNVPYLVADLTKSIASKTFPDIDGTLGYGAFKDRIVALDAPHSALNISEPLSSATTCPAACGDIALITFGHHGPPIVTTTGFTINGQPITVQVDTMYTGTLLIFPTSVEKLKLTDAASTRTTKYFAFTDGGVDMGQAEARKIGFLSSNLAASAPLYFAGPKVHLPDGLFDGTVGQALLSSHKTTFDFHDNKFWLD